MHHVVMLIDDSDADLLFTRIVIERSGTSWDVISFEDATAALAHLQSPASQPVDLILLDINMPRMNGFEFLAAYERLRDEHRARAVVVMLTSSPDAADRARALAFEAVHGYVTKPIDADAVRGLLQYLP